MDFMDYQEYRSSIVEDKVDELVSHVKSGASEMEYDPGDLSTDEIEQVRDEVERLTGKHLN